MSGLEASLVLIGVVIGLMLVLGAGALGGIYFLSRREASRMSRPEASRLSRREASRS